MLGYPARVPPKSFSTVNNRFRGYPGPDYGLPSKTVQDYHTRVTQKSIFHFEKWIPGVLCQSTPKINFHLARAPPKSIFHCGRWILGVPWQGPDYGFPLKTVQAGYPRNPFSTVKNWFGGKGFFALLCIRISRSGG